MSRNAPRTFYEFFAGGGMARLGLGDGWACAFANDFDPVKARTYRANFADAAKHFHEGDVWDINPSKLLGPVDLAWASSPCQDFSLAGSRAGLKGGRSSAFFGFWRVMEALAAERRAPRTIVIENVIGLLSSHGGADFEALCSALANQGYRFGALEIDAAEFVPQSRARVFLIATKLPVPAKLTGPSEYQTNAVCMAFARLSKRLRRDWIWWKLPHPAPRDNSLEDILEPNDQVKWHDPSQTRTLSGLLSPLHAKKLTLMAAAGGQKAGTGFRRMRQEDGVKRQRLEVRFDGMAGCLRTPGGGSSRQTLVLVSGGELKTRLLTSREGARLMGLPETYKLPKSTTAAMHVIGDGVVVNVVAWLAKNILTPLARYEEGGQTIGEISGGTRAGP